MKNSIFLAASTGIIIGVACAVVLVAVLLFVLLRPREKTSQEPVFDSKRIIRENTAKFAIILSKLENVDSDLYDSMKVLQQKLEYSTPSKEQRIIDMDKKISDKIDDLKIEVTRACERGDGFDNVKKLSNDIKDKLADRNALAEMERLSN